MGNGSTMMMRINGDNEKLHKFTLKTVLHERKASGDNASTVNFKHAEFTVAEFTVAELTVAEFTVAEFTVVEFTVMRLYDRV